MRAAVTDQGIMIPKELLDGWTEVVILRNGDRVEVTAADPGVEEDPILGLGKHPVQCGIADGSINHDKYVHRP